MSVKSILFVARADDGEQHPDLDDYEYVSLDVVVNGDKDGSLSGYFLPPVAEHIRRRLGTGSAYEEVVEMVRTAVAIHKPSCLCEACYWLDEKPAAL